MKLVDMDLMDLVHSGEGWEHAQPPCNRQMIHHLEKNEGLVTWLQPRAGTVEDQFPAIRIGGHYYTLSLRMMKAVWRHVRLRKGFVNLERAPFGGMKLRIPSLLFVEKMRTQSRFNLMRMEGVGAVKERRSVQNASYKVSAVIQKMLLPLLDVPMKSHVVFDVEDEDPERVWIDHVRQSRPEVMEDRESFMEYLGRLFDWYVSSDSRGRMAGGDPSAV